jgi:hypothetical protein
LDQHGILAGPVKSLDFQVLLDALGKEFDLPVAATEFSQLQGGQVQMVS